MGITVDGRQYTGSQVPHDGGDPQLTHVDCPCWKTGTFAQVPCPWHDGRDNFPIGAFAASQDAPALKPPLGLMPRDVWHTASRRRRVVDLLDAMARYCKAKKAIPAEWVDELTELVHGVTQ